MTKIAKIGNSGPRVRSDCYVQMELQNSGGIQFELKSKVGSLYGESITQLVNEVLGFYRIEHARIELTDKGAVPWVIMARLEAAIKELKDTDTEFLPEFSENNKYVSAREANRFSRLYLPGNTPSMFLNAGLHQPNGIILDLEDAVAPAKKDEARIMVRNALRVCNFYGAERMVRINQGARGIKDLKSIIPHNVHLILVPKVESADNIKEIETEINKLRKEYKIEEQVFLMPIIESAMGVEKAFEIASSSDNIVAVAIGLEDYTADIGAQRTHEGAESFYARSRVVNAAHAAKIQPIDSVFSDVSDMEALANNVAVSKGLGFEGMGCIHPRQVPVIKQGFGPSAEEIEKAKKIVHAANKAEQLGLGVVALGSKMIDPPVVKRHMKRIQLALNLGLLESDWEGKMEE